MQQPLKIKDSELYIYDYKISAITNDYTEISDYIGGGFQYTDSRSCCIFSI